MFSSNKSSNLLIDFYGEGFKTFVNVSLANGFFHESFDEKEYYELSQNLDFRFPTNIPKKLNIIFLMELQGIDLLKKHLNH